jgi:hypothetical protein
MLRSFDRLRTQHERKIFCNFNTNPVHPEPVEACPELVEGGEHASFQKGALYMYVSYLLGPIFCRHFGREIDSPVGGIVRREAVGLIPLRPKNCLRRMTMEEVHFVERSMYLLRSDGGTEPSISSRPTTC